MMYIHARARRNRGAWLRTLLADHARQLRESAKSHEQFVAELADRDIDFSVIAVDIPAPAKGYAIVIRSAAALSPEAELEEDYAVARLHMLSGQPQEAYRALFSQMRGQVRQRREAVKIIVYISTVTDEVIEAIKKYGQDYGIELADYGYEYRAGDDDEGDVIEYVEDTSKESAPSASSESLTEVSNEVEAIDIASAESEPEYTAEESAAPQKSEEKDDSANICQKCGREFGSPQGLASHMRTHK